MTFSSARNLEHPRQPFSGMGKQVGRYLLRCTFGYDQAATFAALRPQIDHPIRALDHVQIVLDHNQRAAAVDQLAEGRQQLGNIVEVQPGGRFVQDLEHPAGLRGLGVGVGRAHLRQVGGQLDALRLAA